MNDIKIGKAIKKSCMPSGLLKTFSKQALIDQLQQKMEKNDEQSKKLNKRKSDVSKCLKAPMQ